MSNITIIIRYIFAIASGHLQIRQINILGLCSIFRGTIHLDNSHTRQSVARPSMSLGTYKSGLGGLDPPHVFGFGLCLRVPDRFNHQMWLLLVERTHGLLPTRFIFRWRSDFIHTGGNSLWLQYLGLCTDGNRPQFRVGGFPGTPER